MNDYTALIFGMASHLNRSLSRRPSKAQCVRWWRRMCALNSASPERIADIKNERRWRKCYHSARRRGHQHRAATAVANALCYPYGHAP
jgi:hypothetical protein